MARKIDLANKMPARKKTVYQSPRSGRFVMKSYAKRHKATTLGNLCQSESVENPTNNLHILRILGAPKPTCGAIMMAAPPKCPVTYKDRVFLVERPLNLRFQLTFPSVLRRSETASHLLLPIETVSHLSVPFLLKFAGIRFRFRGKHLV